MPKHSHFYKLCFPISRKEGSIIERTVNPNGDIAITHYNILKEQGAYIVTLGNRILRTETAGFTATALIQYELGDLGGKLL